VKHHKSPPAPNRAGGHAALALALSAAFVGLTACEQTRPVAPAPAASPVAAGLDAAGIGLAIPGGAFASFDGATCPVSELPPGVSADVAPFPGYLTLSASTTGYPIFDIGPLSGGVQSYAYDVNDATPRQVVGGSQQPGGFRAFAWTEPGGFIDLGVLPGGTESFAQGNNNANVVVGYSGTPTSRTAFKWSQGTGMVALASLPGGSYGDAWDINESGQVAGWSRVNADDEHATLWSPAGVPQDLGTLPGGRKSYAYDVNNNGWVVGYGSSTAGRRAFLWKPGTGMQDLGILPGGIYSQAMGINDNGEVVGFVFFGTYYRGFYWSQSTGMIDIGSLDGSATQTAFAWDINNAGQVTGYSRVVGNTAAVNAFLWTRSGGMQNLGKHVSSCSSYGYGMNNAGYVSGSDEFTGLRLGHRAALWTTTPPNNPPTLSNVVGANGTCAAKPSVTFTATDADGPAPLTYTVQWSDGTSASGSYTSGVPVTVEKAGPYVNGSYTATITVRDGKGAIATATATVTYLCVGSVGDFAWIDANGNGRQDAGEPGLADVKLTLGGAGSGSQTTTASGAYLFGNLAMGSYTVTATAPAGWLPTIVNAPGTTGANDSDGNPASATLTASSPNDLTLDFGFVQRAVGGKGCTPGYWKQPQHLDSWKWYATTDLVDAVFGVTYRPSGATQSLTLLQAVSSEDNQNAEQLFRHGTAALLNAVYQSGVSYAYTAPQVIEMVRTAYLTGSKDRWNATKDLLDKANQAGCPLN
jgi:probable HAF family extracellular repeat protein